MVSRNSTVAVLDRECRPEPLRSAGIAARRDSTGWIAGSLLLAAIAALAIDMPTARWLVSGDFPDVLNKPLRFSEAFGHGIGVAMFLAAAWVLDPLGRMRLVRMGAAAFGSGLAANLGKILIARTRPRYFDLTHGVFDSFADWLPLLTAQGDHQSFPSSHTATAAGFAVALAWRYPRGRWFFGAMVVMVAMQRLSGNSHFVSDLIFGAAIGYVFAHACLPGGIFSGVFDRFEQRMAASANASHDQFFIKSNWN